MSSNRWNNTTKVVVLAGVGLLVIVLLVTFQAMIAPTIIALLFTFILHRPVNWIQRRIGWSRGASIVLIYIAVLALLGLSPILIAPGLQDSFVSLQSALDELLRELQTRAPEPLLVLGEFALSAEDLFQQMGSSLQELLSPLATGALGLAASLTSGILAAVYALVLSFWLLKDLHKLQRLLLEQLPSEYNTELRQLGRELSAIWHAFLRGQFVLGVVVGLATWIPLALVGMPNAAGLALLAGVMEFLPTVGPLISGAIGTTAALFGGSLWLPVGNLSFALLVLAVYAIIAQVESVYLIPRLVGRRVRLHPGVAFAGLVNGALVFGVLGVLLAIPVIASARTLIAYLNNKLRDREPFESDPLTLESVPIRGLIAGHRVEAIIFDLDGVLIKPRFCFAERLADRLAWLDRVLTRAQRRRAGLRMLVLLEGPVNRWIGLLSRLNFHQNIERTLPALNEWRGWAPAPAVQPIEDVTHLVEYLIPRYRLGIVTARSRKEVDVILRRSMLANHHFCGIVTREDVSNLPPHGEAVAQCLLVMQVSPEHAMMVSDTELNLRAAQALGTTTCGVLDGLGNQDDLDDADLLVEKTVELAEWL